MGCRAAKVRCTEPLGFFKIYLDGQKYPGGQARLALIGASCIITLAVTTNSGRSMTAQAVKRHHLDKDSTVAWGLCFGLLQSFALC
jgi:hypothetical protein